MVERPNTLAGLLEKRRQIAGEVNSLRAQLNGLLADLEHLDATIRLFDPNGEVPIPKPAKGHGPDASFKGEMRRFVLTYLRNAAPREVTSLDIAVWIVEGKGMNAADRRYVSMIRKRVTACLYKLRVRGLVREVPLQGEYKGWALAR